MLSVLVGIGCLPAAILLHSSHVEHKAPGRGSSSNRGLCAAAFARPEVPDAAVVPPVLEDVWENDEDEAVEAAPSAESVWT